jgi:hypothetical protein
VLLVVSGQGFLGNDPDAPVRPPSAFAFAKRLLYELDDLAFEESIDHWIRVNVEARITETCRAGVRCFLKRRGFEGLSPHGPVSTGAFR